MQRILYLAALALLVSAYALSLPAHIHAAGRTVAVTGSLQAAVNAAQPGDVLVLQRATYVEAKVLINTAGTAAAPITIQGAGRDASVLQGKLVLGPAAAFWSLQDMSINVNGGDDDAVRLESSAHDVTLRRVHLYNGKGYGVRVMNDVANVLIEDCEIERFDAGSRDAHGVGIQVARNITIRRCDIHHTSGDAIQSNTGDYPGFGRVASNIVIENNALHDTRENAIDIKSTHGLVARNNRMWGFRAVDSSEGVAIQVQYDARDVQVIGNQVWSAVEGIEVTRGVKDGTRYPSAPQRVTIAGNLFGNLSSATITQSAAAYRVYLPLVARAAATGGTSARYGIVIRASSDVRVYNNTVYRGVEVGMYIGTSGNGDTPRNLDVRNNVLGGSQNDLALAYDPQQFTNLIVDYNHYISGKVNGKRLSDWLAKGYERHATTGDPRLNSMLLPLSDSPLIDSGVQVGLPFTGAAPDRGWGELGR